MIVVYTDGALAMGVGGWAFWVDETLYRSGGVSQTTSPRMELVAVIQAMSILGPKARRAGGLVIYTDSLYVVDCFADGWYHRWRKNDWKRRDYGRSTYEEVKNRDLWERLLELHERYVAEGIPISYRHIRGHGKDPSADPVHIEGNRMADQLAVAARKKHLQEEEEARKQ